MQSNLQKRLAKLEAASVPAGATVVVNVTYDEDFNERTPDDAARVLADARQKAGTHGTVIIVEHVDMVNALEGDV